MQPMSTQRERGRASRDWLQAQTTVASRGERRQSLGANKTYKVSFALVHPGIGLIDTCTAQRCSRGKGRLERTNRRQRSKRVGREVIRYEQRAHAQRGRTQQEPSPKRPRVNRRATMIGRERKPKAPCTQAGTAPMPKRYSASRPASPCSMNSSWSVRKPARTQQRDGNNDRIRGRTHAWKVTNVRTSNIEYAT